MSIVSLKQKLTSLIKEIIMTATPVTETTKADSKTVSKTALVWDSTKKVLSITDTNGNFLIRSGKPSSVEIKKQTALPKWDLLVFFGENIRCFEIESEQRDDVEYFFQQLILDDSKQLFYSVVIRSTFLSVMEDLYKNQKLPNKNEMFSNDKIDFDELFSQITDKFNISKDIFLFPRLSGRYNIPR